MNTEGVGLKGWLGIDAGGTRTRWARVDDSGTAIAEGEGAGMAALQSARSSLPAAPEATWREARAHHAAARLAAAARGSDNDARRTRP